MRGEEPIKGRRGRYTGEIPNHLGQCETNYSWIQFLNEQDFANLPGEDERASHTLCRIDESPIQIEDQRLKTLSPHPLPPPR